MNKDTFILITAIVGSPLLGIWVTSFFNKKKTGAETHNLNISGEINIGEAWQKYAVKIQQDMADLQAKFSDLSKQFDEMRSDNEKLKTEKLMLAKENTDYQLRVKRLESEVSVLKEEIAKYKGLGATIDTVKEAIHESVDVAAEQIKNNIQ